MTSTIGAGDIAGVGVAYTNLYMSQNSGGWYLDLRSQNTRTVYLNFTGNGITGTGPAPSGTPFNPGSGPYKVFMYSACNLYTPSVRLLDMDVNTSATCPMAVWFEVGGKSTSAHELQPGRRHQRRDRHAPRFRGGRFGPGRRAGATEPAFILKGKATRASCHKGTTTCRFPRSTSRIRRVRTLPIGPIEVEEHRGPASAWRS